MRTTSRSALIVVALLPLIGAKGCFGLGAYERADWVPDWVDDCAAEEFEELEDDGLIDRFGSRRSTSLDWDDDIRAQAVSAMRDCGVECQLVNGENGRFWDALHKSAGGKGACDIDVFASAAPVCYWAPANGVAFRGEDPHPSPDDPDCTDNPLDQYWHTPAECWAAYQDWYSWASTANVSWTIHFPERPCGQDGLHLDEDDRTEPVG